MNNCLLCESKRPHQHINEYELINKYDFSKINYIFVHIPKCAGTYIKYVLKRNYDCVIINIYDLNKYENRFININHTSFNKFLYPERIITFVRNPYSRVKSMYLYHKLFKTNNSINDFIKKLYDNKKIYNYIKNNVMDKNYVFNLLKTHKGTNIAYSWKSQSSWLPSADIFFVGKIENLENDLEKLLNKLGYEYKNKFKKRNITGYKYNTDLSQESKDMIYDLYRSDFDRFNYPK